MGQLLKKQTVLYDDNEPSHTDRYFAAPLEEELSPVAVHLDIEVWKEMGSPTQITVTIEPGDKLNVEMPETHTNRVPLVIDSTKPPA